MKQATFQDTVLITGAAGGIGSAIAARAADEGQQIACIDLNGLRVAETAAELRRKGARAIGISCDLTDADAAEAAVQQVVDEFGGIGALFANAGGSGGERDPFLDLTYEAFRDMLDRNLMTAFNTALPAARHMASSGGGAIVFTASQLGIAAREGCSHYGTAKAGLLHLARCMAVDLADLGIRVNSVAPGPTLTPSNRERFLNVETRDDLLRSSLIGRYGEASEIAEAAVFLASSRSSYTTGATLVVDGGYTVT